MSYAEPVFSLRGGRARLIAYRCTQISVSEFRRFVGGHFVSVCLSVSSPSLCLSVSLSLSLSFPPSPHNRCLLTTKCLGSSKISCWPKSDANEVLCSLYVFLDDSENLEFSRLNSRSSACFTMSVWSSLAAARCNSDSSSSLQIALKN